MAKSEENQRKIAAISPICMEMPTFTGIEA
jgi:hypothetical protein